MFSGLQELLVIAAVVGVLVVSSRLRKQPAADNSSPPRRFNFTGPWRAAVALSLTWTAGIAIYLWPWDDGLRPFLLVGVVPVAAGWSIAWVVAGFRREGK